MWLSALPCTFIASLSMAKCRPSVPVRSPTSPVSAWLQGSGSSGDATVSIGVARETVRPDRTPRSRPVRARGEVVQGAAPVVQTAGRRVPELREQRVELRHVSRGAPEGSSGPGLGGHRCESLSGGSLACLAGVHRPTISPPGLGGITPPGRAVPTFRRGVLPLRTRADHGPTSPGGCSAAAGGMWRPGGCETGRDHVGDHDRDDHERHQGDLVGGQQEARQQDRRERQSQHHTDMAPMPIAAPATRGSPGRCDSTMPSAAPRNIAGKMGPPRNAASETVYASPFAPISSSSVPTEYLALSSAGRPAHPAR